MNTETSNYLATLAKDFSEPKLTVEKNKIRANLAELKLSAEVTSLVNSFCVSLPVFEQNLTEFLENTSTGNNTNLWIWYKLVSIEKGVEIWHQNANGDSDRLVFIVREKEVANG